MATPKLQTYHVPSGSFHFGSRQSIQLQAFLGSCVGVAIYDLAAEIGGMIHLLLPEPVNPSSRFQAERYASTGLPIFIKALNDAGASPGKMQAVVAGGALVDPVSEQDLALNIGSRTADVVKNILCEEKIKINQSETGGLFACTLNLNMQNWETRIQPVGLFRVSLNDAPCPRLAMIF
jgi:chemotaxis receptor (MCP) glutamine deamidase CheD